MRRPLPYDLTEQSERDIEEIFAYTEAQFGLAQAVKYLLAFDGVLTEIADNPKLGRARNEIRKGLLSMTQESHVIFYRIVQKRIRVIRILHGRRDLPNVLG